MRNFFNKYGKKMFDQNWPIQQVEPLTVEEWEALDPEEGMETDVVGIGKVKYENGAWVTILDSNDIVDVKYLVIGGGGGGGSVRSGGGGAGGYRTNWNEEDSAIKVVDDAPFLAFLGREYNITVGAGGANNSDGSDSSIDKLVVAKGGARGGQSVQTGNDGGCGSGAGNSGGTTILAGGKGSQGGDGGNRDESGGSTSVTGGGGGVGENGFTNPTNTVSGSGGDGLSSTITGSAVTRAGGGGGGANSGFTAGTGGAGGGGNGEVSTGGAGSGTANTGSGGGGRFDGSTGGLGGSGVIILRYPDIYEIEVGAGLTSSTTTVGSDKVTTFTAGTDTIEFKLAS